MTVPTAVKQTARKWTNDKESYVMEVLLISPVYVVTMINMYPVLVEKRNAPTMFLVRKLSILSSGPAFTGMQYLQNFGKQKLLKSGLLPKTFSAENFVPQNILSAKFQNIPGTIKSY